jgi:glycosyltransferase involved in cell wall biosynthesis
LRALQHQVPILVPEAVEALRDLCLVSNAGLVYENADELKACLMRLLSDEPLRQALGSYGSAFLTSQGTSSPTPKAVS